MERRILRMQEGARLFLRTYSPMPENLPDDRRDPKLVCKDRSLCRILVHNPFFQHGLPPFRNSKRACHGTGSLLYPSTAAGFAAGRRSVRFLSSIQSWLAMKMEE